MLTDALPKHAVSVSARGHEVRVGERDTDSAVVFAFSPGTWVEHQLYTMLDQLQSDISEWTTELWPANWIGDRGQTILQPYVTTTSASFEIGFGSSEDPTDRLRVGFITR